MPLIVRAARPSDARAMSEVINPIIAEGGTTAHRQPFDEQRMIEHYIDPTYGIHCAVAVEDRKIVGFQALEWCDPNWPGQDRLPADWVVIATFVALDRHGQGIGRRLFAATLAAGRAAGVRTIDATIRRENVGGLIFYSRLGFVDYRTGDATICKRINLS
jgi:GNAT superfamily N-acetyltransferase